MQRSPPNAQAILHDTSPRSLRRLFDRLASWLLGFFARLNLSRYVPLENWGFKTAHQDTC
jgi:hypothetical protein